MEDRIEGAVKYPSQARFPIVFAGFNLGNFHSVALDQGGYHIEVFANRELESALTPPTVEQVPGRSYASPQTRIHRERSDRRSGSGAPQTPPDPGARVQQLTKSVIDALEFMTSTLGPAPLRNLAITPIPADSARDFPAWFIFPRWLTSTPISALLSSASATSRRFIPNSSASMRWRINGGETWWFPPATGTNG